MIECPGCKISFSPRHRICPICKCYKAKLDDRVEYLANKAELALDRGVRPADVESMLVEEGVPSLVASEIIVTQARKVARSERSYGVFRLLGGLAILLCSSVLALLGALTSPSRVAFYLFMGALLAGAAAIRPFILGLYSVLTGREKQ
jgi:hypothetical protein